MTSPWSRRKHAARTSDYRVRVIITTTFTTCHDVAAHSSEEACSVARAKANELLADLGKPSVAETFDVQVEVVDATLLEKLIDPSAAD